MGLEHIAPHDLRRTCAKLCHTNGGELEQIQFLLGHVSVQTTERYLEVARQLLGAGCKPDARFFGFDPLSVARSIKCQPLIELLESAIPPKRAGKKKK